jgi:hypothetical protein
MGRKTNLSDSLRIRALTGEMNLRKIGVKVQKGEYLGKGDYIYHVYYKGLEVGKLRKVTRWRPQRTKVTIWLAIPNEGLQAEFPSKYEAINYLIKNLKEKQILLPSPLRYYCPICKRNHIIRSKIGRLHRR